MFELSLLIGLPKPDSIDTASLSPEEAAVKLRQAATLRLNGAQSILLHSPQHVKLAVELLDDAAVLFDKAFRYLTGIPAQRAHQQAGEYYSVAAVKGGPRIRTPWGIEYGPIIEDGVRCAQTWLDDSTLPLAWALAQKRRHHRPGISRESFETGFFLRLEQELMILSELADARSPCFKV